MRWCLFFSNDHFTYFRLQICPLPLSEGYRVIQILLGHSSSSICITLYAISNQQLEIHQKSVRFVSDIREIYPIGYIPLLQNINAQ